MTEPISHPRQSRKICAVVLILGLFGAGFCLWATIQGALPWLTLRQSYWFEFGRGSGLSGLNTVKVAENGTVTLHRRNGDESGRFWETGSLTLSKEGMLKLNQAIESRELLNLQRQYHDDQRIEDGRQWVLLIRQGDNMKSVYFNNHFPPAIVNFADDLDNVLAEGGMGDIHWCRVNDNERDHERELWETLRR